VVDATRPGNLSADLIVRTALDVADREGLEALSMRRVGAELGCAAMSLYGHVANKEELLERLADHVMGKAPPVDRSRPWDEAIVAFFFALHGVLLEHPAVAQVVTQRPTSGPHTRRHGDAALAVLRSGGLPDQLAVEAFTALSCYTLGAALYAAARATARAEDPAWVGFGSLPVDEPLRTHLAERAGRGQFRSGLEHLVRGYADEVG
jgi:AcrR family transcriptional regulator